MSRREDREKLLEMSYALDKWLRERDITPWTSEQFEQMVAKANEHRRQHPDEWGEWSRVEDEQQ